MILRRLTEHLRTQNWFAVFLDFVIVVVGVFLGIQLGNWNEARSEQARVETYLEQILVDLEADIETGQRGVRYADGIDASADRLIAVAEGRAGADEITDTELVAAVPEAGYAYLPYGTSATYEEMISTGALGHLRDLELKRELAHYYAWLSASRQWDDLVREEQYAYRAAIRGILSREQFAWARASYQLDDPTRSPLADFDRTAFVERLRARPAILDSLRSMGAVQQRLRDNSLTMQREAEDLAARVREELADK
jgi:hypothetical protein